MHKSKFIFSSQINRSLKLSLFFSVAQSLVDSPFQIRTNFCLSFSRFVSFGEKKKNLGFTKRNTNRIVFANNDNNDSEKKKDWTNWKLKMFCDHWPNDVRCVFFVWLFERLFSEFCQTKFSFENKAYCEAYMRSGCSEVKKRWKISINFVFLFFSLSLFTLHRFFMYVKVLQYNKIVKTHKHKTLYSLLIISPRCNEIL